MAPITTTGTSLGYSRSRPMEEQAFVQSSEVHGLTLFLTRCVPFTRSNWAYSSIRESRAPAGKPTLSTHAMGSFAGIKARFCSSRVACFPGQCLGTLSVGSARKSDLSFRKVFEAQQPIRAHSHWSEIAQELSLY